MISGPLGTSSAGRVLSREALDRRVAAILAFLRDSQQPDGEFPTYRAFPGVVPSYVGATSFDGWYDFGKCPFCTANIAYHLADLDLPGTEEIRRKACASLARGMEHGVARYVPAYAKAIDFPTDVDDTCLAAMALDRHGIPSGCNADMVLDNVTGTGDIYTWLIPRWRHLRHPGNYRWLRADQRTFTDRMRGYGTPPERMAAMAREYRESFEPAVAANVLLHLGIDARTAPLLRTLIHRVQSGDVPLGYYATLNAASFHVARLRRRVPELTVTRDRILTYLGSRQQDDGGIDGPFNTAMAALTFMYFDAWDAPPLARAMHYLASHSMHEEGWRPLHYCNDLDGVFVDGGAELTATFYLEALYRWSRRETHR